MAMISHSNISESDLLEQNMGLVIKIANSFNPINSTILDDYIQTGRIGLLNAIRTYDANLGKFSTNAWNHIRWAILNYIETEQKQENLPITLEPSGTPPQDNITEYLPNTLSDKERDVILLRNEGHTFKDIGAMHGFSKSWANYTFHSGILKIQQANYLND